MTKRMLIDATHPEETRVAIVNGNKLEEFDFESAVRKQLKGNIYLVKVTRVEPSLQAAFVDFGGNRHGFLPFPEIHPDYYRIPVADREALIAEERNMAETDADTENTEEGVTRDHDHDHDHDDDNDDHHHHDEEADAATDETPGEPADETGAEQGDAAADETAAEQEAGADNGTAGENVGDDAVPQKRTVETVGGGDFGDRPLRSNLKRRYKIQEVIKRGQIMLVQISKEERGAKGAAVTTYLSLPGRYCVLMPNSPRGGGVSRKVSSMQDRARMKQLMGELDIPDGMSVILRTAGIERNKIEINRDLEYLMKLWNGIREQTLSSSAPALVHEEGNLVRRAIRDLYRKDISEVLVAGAGGYRTAREFMKILMPTHVRRVRYYREEHIPLFYRYQVEAQIDEIHNPVVRLKSGGYIVIGTTEALVAIDVNSGKSTKGRHIEETALKTNIEAAEEVARQLRLRDLGGLVVIDFIDMEDMRNNRIVERKLRDAMQSDRARIQLGRISPFGLLELSRQRLHPSLVETNFETCPHCQGAGLVRTVETMAVNILRAIEEEGIKGRAEEIRVSVLTRVANYISTQKSAMLADIEARHAMKAVIVADDGLTTRPNFKIDITKTASPDRVKPVIERKPLDLDLEEDMIEDIVDEIDEESDESRNADFAPGEGEGDDLPPEETATQGEGNVSFEGGRHNRHRGDRNGRRRRGGRNRGGRDRDRNRHQNQDTRQNHGGGDAADPALHAQTGQDNGGAQAPLDPNAPQGNNGSGGEGQGRDGNRRRRGRRGGKRRRGGQGRNQQGGFDRPPQADGDNGTSSSQAYPLDAPQPVVDVPRPHRNHRGGNDNEHKGLASSGQDTPRPETASAPAAPPKKGWWRRLTE